MNTESSLSKWFDDQKERRSQTQIIEEGFLKGNLSSYYFYRLRYFLIRTLLGALIFSIEIRILIEGFGKEFFTQSLGARTLVVLITAFWWAGLELLRSEIRTFKREDKPYIIPNVILSWRQWATKVTLIVASVSSIGLGLWSVASPQTLFSAYGFYVLTLVARVLVDIPLRAYHSCVYATMRIYRPLYWIVATELVAFALFLILRPSIGAWSVGVSSLVGLILSSSISYYYISQTYRFLGYDSGVKLAKEKNKKKNRSHSLPHIKEFIKKALPLTIFRLDAVLVLVLIAGSIYAGNKISSSLEPNSYYQLILIALCMPLLYAAQEWSMLLYFDYKKLELRIFEKLRTRFSVGIKYLIVVLSIFLWLLLPLLQFMAGQGWHYPPLSVLALLLTSSYLGQQAIRVFSLGSNKELFFWGLSLLTFLTIFLVLGSAFNMDLKLIWISVILLGHAVGLNIFAKDKSLDASKIMMPPTQWLKTLKKTTLPWGGLIRIVLPDAKEEDNTKFILREAAQGLRRAFPGPLYITSLTRTGLLFFGCGKQLIDKNYPTDSAKLFEEIRRVIVPLLPSSLERMIFLPITIDPKEFLENLAQGETKLKACISPIAPKVSKEKVFSFDFVSNNNEVSVEDCREILSSAIRYHNIMDARGDKMAPNWEVACEESEGTIVKIHAIKRKKRSGMSKWIHDMTRLNLWKSWNNEEDPKELNIFAKYQTKTN